jgi:hypothetical protein
MKDLLKGVTKNDLLKLKNSKAVPITAHSHEVVVPVVYATRVKEFMRKEGMRVPLKPEELQALKQKARDTEGEMEEYAKGGTIKLKKVKAKKIKIKSISKSNVLKNVIKINVGAKPNVVRRAVQPRAKPVGKENQAIRPGVSTYPSYTTMYSSSGIMPQQAQTLQAYQTTSNVAGQSSLLKEQSKPIKEAEPSLAKPGRIQGPLPQAAEEALIRQRLTDDRKRQAREITKINKAAKAAAEVPPVPPALLKGQTSMSKFLVPRTVVPPAAPASVPPPPSGTPPPVATARKRPVSSAMASKSSIQ